MSKVRWVGYLLAAVVAVALLTAMVWKPAPAPRFEGLDKVMPPMAMGGFRGQVVPVDDKTRQALVSAECAARQYTAPDGAVVDLVMIGGTDRSALHDPRSCLFGAGWSLTDDHVENVPGTGVPVRDCHASFASGSEKASYDVEYLYVSDGQIIASATQIRWALLKAALLEQNSRPVYFVRMMTALPSDNAGRARAHSRLQSFGSALWSAIGPKLVTNA